MIWGASARRQGAEATDPAKGYKQAQSRALLAIFFSSCLAQRHVIAPVLRPWLATLAASRRSARENPNNATLLPVRASELRKRHQPARGQPPPSPGRQPSPILRTPRPAHSTIDLHLTAHFLRYVAAFARRSCSWGHPNHGWPVLQRCSIPDSSTCAHLALPSALATRHPLRQLQ